MEINQTIELPDGSVTFQAKLTQPEVDVIIAAGLNYLLQQGILPMKAVAESDIAKMVDGSEELQ